MKEWDKLPIKTGAKISSMNSIKGKVVGNLLDFDLLQLEK